MQIARLLALLFCLSSLAGASVALAQIRCSIEAPNAEPSSVRFGVQGKAIRDFKTQTVISSNGPDLRPGYAAWTCYRNLADFEQTTEGRLVVLKHRPLQGAKEERVGCKVVFELGDKAIRTFTTGCASSCLQFDLTFDKSSKLCRNG